MGRRTFDSDDDVEPEVEEREDEYGVDVNAGDDEEDEEEEEGQDDYERDGFIVDDVEEEEEAEEEQRESDEDERRKRKKRRKRELEYQLDEDDYDLLNENIPGFHRPKEASKKFKRLKKAGRETELEEPSGFSDDEEVGRIGRGGRTAEEELKRSLFGGDDGAPLEDIAEEEEPVEEEEEGDINEEDEMADFIVDEEEMDENGAPVRRKKFSKRKLRRAPGISSSALQEAHDIFGDVDELLRVRKEGFASTEEAQKDLEDEFEPFVLSEKYMTRQDNLIREADVPERIQLFEEVTGPAPTDPKGLEEESTWMLTNLISDSQSILGDASPLDEINKEDISRVLALFHSQKLDIPFIAMYRKEECVSLLKVLEQDETESGDMPQKACKLKWHKALWAVLGLDRKWLLLQKRKNSLRLYFSRRSNEEVGRIDHETLLNLNMELCNSILTSLHKAESEREIDDVEAKFGLHFPPGEITVAEGQFKRPQRKTLYTTCRNAGLWEVSRKFGFSSEQLGSHFTLENLRKGELEDAKETPEEVATNFTRSGFETPQLVLKGARYMAALEISCEPDVRKHVRKIFLESAVVSTWPTSEGNSLIDSFHQFAGVKWLRNKPLPKFEGAQWLLIQKAEEEKLLQVAISLPDEAQNKVFSDFSEAYLSDGVSKSAQLWNEQRKLILDDAISKYILPSMVKEARELLTTRAKNFLLMEYGKQLWAKVSVAPYQHKDHDKSSDEDAAPRVMACCWGPGKPPTTFVMLDSSGEVLDVLYAGSINSRVQNAGDQQCKISDRQRLVKFMIDHQPQIIVLGATNLSCTRLKDNIYEAIFDIMKEHPRDVDSDIDDLKVVYGEESLPRIYENSRISSDQLPGQAGIVKRAAALGRYLQNPLAMIATLCGPGREILSWKLSPMDHFLTPDDKYGIIEQIMIDVTNQVGVDMNLAASHEWLLAPLQFISGLGPRKASGLQRALVRAGAIFSRRELVGNFMKKKVFINAAAFLRIRRNGVASGSSHIIDLLDDTRIHPESYRLAKSMAKAVYDEDAQEDQNDSDNDDDDAQEMAVEHVRDNPRMLRILDIDEYAKSFEERTGVRKRETLYDIKMELLHGFEEWRVPYAVPSQDEEFFMISGETDESLFVGQPVQATVRRVQPDHVTCVLDSGLTGLIMRDDLRLFAGINSRDSVDVDATEIFTVGTVLFCKIKRLQKDRYLVYLTSRDAKINVDGERLTKLDPYYEEERSKLPSEQEKVHKEKEFPKRHFKPRMITHPHFRNWAADEAREFLADKEAGESIFRPSLNGPSFLTLTLKIYDGVYADKDIAESGKDHKDITSLLRLGKSLKIADDTFEDLDEVMDRYVDPLVAHLKAILGYRKFRTGTKAEIDELLRSEKAEYPSRIVYCFGISHEHPGTLILSYIRSANPHHLYIGLYPKGFKFQSRFFDNIDRLVAYFQQHINDIGYEVRQSNIAASVPLKSPAAGGSPWGSWAGPASNGGNCGWREGHRNFGRERSSTPSSRAGRYDDQSSGGRDSPRSGTPRPHAGRGRGRAGGFNRERGIYNGSERRNSDLGSSKGKEDFKDDGWGSFPGARVQSSPGKETFPGGFGGGWGTSGGTTSGEKNGSGWGSGGNSGAQNGTTDGWNDKMHGGWNKPESCSGGSLGGGGSGGGGWESKW